MSGTLTWQIKTSVEIADDGNPSKVDGMMEMMKHDMMKWRIWPVCLSMIAILYWNDPLEESRKS